jgi:hypothetical protein
MIDIEKVLKDVCDFLNENDLRYVIVGGIAVMYHGVPRTTVNIDLRNQLSEIYHSHNNTIWNKPLSFLEQD